MSPSRHQNIFSLVDKTTVFLYLAMLLFGWISVCGASYTFGDAEIFSLSARSGMQVVWIGTALLLAGVILLLDDRYYDTLAYVLYAGFIVVLFLTIFNPHTIKGSRSWLVFGPIHIQPAEFAKFATALAISKFMSGWHFDLKDTPSFYRACGIVLLPMLLIIAQRETGSALVYISFFLMFYREGMPGFILFAFASMVTYFVVGIRYQDEIMFKTPTYVGPFVVYLLIQVFTILLHRAYFYKHHKERRWMWLAIAVSNVFGTLLSIYVWKFNIAILQLLVIVGMTLFLVYRAVYFDMRKYILLVAFTVGSMLVYHSSSFMMNHLLQDHQRTRINVLLGLETDVSGAGYNVHQSKIAIGSGGLTGKGFLNGTQTKLRFVPEQDTDFIFCTVGEEEGFVGAAGVL
ncbi:MAG: rod shape-determining protein RodA, partial [Bacteroidaceae bacterium]|nr:rod shape-determining protein RodA [Bacteroidaceae bacterium]